MQGLSFGPKRSNQAAGTVLVFFKGASEKCARTSAQTCEITETKIRHYANTFSEINDFLFVCPLSKVKKKDKS